MAFRTHRAGRLRLGFLSLTLSQPLVCGSVNSFAMLVPTIFTLINSAQAAIGVHSKSFLFLAACGICASRFRDAFSDLNEEAVLPAQQRAMR